jgi:hypothetical protein
MSSTAFDSGYERLLDWKNLRNAVEDSPRPFDLVIEYWAKVPYVGSFIDPAKRESWPDPWKLIIDGKFDDLALAIAISYTLKLTQRFIKSKIMIHMSITDNQKTPDYFVTVDNEICISVATRQIIDFKDFQQVTSFIICSDLSL